MISRDKKYIYINFTLVLSNALKYIPFEGVRYGKYKIALSLLAVNFFLPISHNGYVMVWIAHNHQKYLYQMFILWMINTTRMRQ